MPEVLTEGLGFGADAEFEIARAHQMLKLMSPQTDPQALDYVIPETACEVVNAGKEKYGIGRMQNFCVPGFVKRAAGEEVFTSVKRKLQEFQCEINSGLAGETTELELHRSISNRFIKLINDNNHNEGAG